MEDKKTEIRHDTELASVSAEAPADLKKPAGKKEPAEAVASAEAAEPGIPKESSDSETAAETAEKADTQEPSEAAEEAGSPEEAETAVEAETAIEVEAAEEAEAAEETETAEPADDAETSEAAEEADTAEAGEKEKTVYPVPARSGADENQENRTTGGTPPSSKSGKIAFWIALFIVLAVAGGIYYAGYKYCLTHFMPGTQINGYDCSKMTVEEAEDRFEEAAQKYVLNIRFRGGETEILHAKDIGFAYKPDGSIDALLQGQDSILWPKYLFEDSGYRIEVSGTVDEEKLKQTLQQLPELQEENMEAPENAYLKFQDGNEEEDGRFVIISDTEGSTIDLVQLTAGVADAACKYLDLVDAEEIAGAYVSASVRADNAKLVSRCKDLNDIVGASITYVLPDGETIRLNADVTKDWLVRDDKGRLTKDDDVWEEKLWAFLQELANNANTLGMRRQFHSSRRGTITVSGGDYGYMVNQIVEHDLLLEDFARCSKETRKPSYYLTPYNEETENDGIGTSYIEADLTAQHIWCYVNGKLAMESDCVSGNMDDGHETPAGVFGIMFMKKNATLRGVMQKDGEYEYETKVKYWMPFYDGCGFHDAWWRTAFGGDIYMKDGSHGCINLPPEAAEQLFSVCDNKMPVVVYY